MTRGSRRWLKTDIPCIKEEPQRNKKHHEEDTNKRGKNWQAILKDCINSASPYKDKEGLNSGRRIQASHVRMTDWLQHDWKCQHN